MQNLENSPENQPNFDRADMEDVFRVFQHYAAEHTGVIMGAGTEVPYSVNESRSLSCKVAMFDWYVMHHSEAIERIQTTVKKLSRLLITEQNQESKHELNYLIEAQVNILGLFCWLEAYGPKVSPLDA